MALSATRPAGVTFAFPKDGSLVTVFESGESPLSSPSDSRASSPQGCRSPTGYQTSAPSTPDGSPKHRKKFRFGKAATGRSKEVPAKRRMAEVKAEVPVGEAGRGKLPWAPRQEAPSQRAVPPWAEPDAQPPPLPSAVYATLTSPTPRRAARPAGPTASVTEPQPKPVHFNRPSPGASPIAPRKSVFGTNLSRRALSSESLSRQPPWADQMRSRTDSPSRAGRRVDSPSRAGSQATDKPSTSSAGAPFSESHSSRRSESLGHLDQKTSESSPKVTGPASGDGRGPIPASLPGQGASEGQGAAVTAQTVGDSVSSCVVRQVETQYEQHQHSVKMVSVKSESETKSVSSSSSTVVTSDPGSPTPWRKARPPADSTAKTAATQQQQQQEQPPWRGVKTDPSSEPKGAEISQQAPWRRQAGQQCKEKETSGAELSKAAGSGSQPVLKKEQKTQITSVSAPSEPKTQPQQQPSSAGVSKAEQSQPLKPATSCTTVPLASVPKVDPAQASTAISAPTTKNTAHAAPASKQAPAANKPESPVPPVNKVASPAPAANVKISPAVTKQVSPAPAVNKLASPAPNVNKPASPAPAINMPASPAPTINKPASPAPAINKPASPAPAINKPASPAPAINKPASPAPAINKPASPTPPITKPGSPAPAVKKPASPVPPPTVKASPDIKSHPSAEQVAPVPKGDKLASAPAQTGLVSTKSSSPLPVVSDLKPSPPAPPAQNESAGNKANAAKDQPPQANAGPSELSSARSPTPPLPPKQTAAEVISAPALPQAPKPIATPAPPPTSAGAAGPAPQSAPPPPVSESTAISTSTTSPSPAPSVSAPKPSSMSAEVALPPPPATAPVIPAPPPEPEPKLKASGPQAMPRDSAEEAKKSIPPHPEFPPPPPLEQEDAPVLPPPPAFLKEERAKPPPSTLPCIGDEDERSEEGDDVPSPEYVRQSVTNRIMAFERHSSRDEESPPKERKTTPVPPRPVAPWVKRTSAGPVQQSGYWDMASPEDQPEDSWPDPPRPHHEHEATIAQMKQISSAKIPSAPSPPPAPSAGRILQPQEASPAGKVIGPPTSKVSGAPPRPHIHPQRKRSTSLGDYRAHYLTPEEPRRGVRMPADGTPVVSPTPSQPPTPSKEKSDDALFDPWCDPKNPRVINFQDVSAAAFKIKSGIMNTPCTRSHMSSITDVEIFFKKEFNQFTGSFKERGARYTLLMLPDAQKKKGVIAASAGNHALALSYHGQDLGIPVTVVMPLVAPIMKVQACRQYGANIIVKGNDIGECREIALRMAKDQDLLYINGYDHPHILAGQGTMGLEIVEQVPNIDAVVIPVGGGGLIAGVALAVKALHPHVQVIGVEAERCASFSAAMKAGSPVYVKAESTLADGLAVPKVGVNAFATAAPLVDKVVTVREEWIAIAILRLVESEKAVVEGAGATALAAILAGELPELKGKRVVIPLCGGNIDTTILGRCLERGLAADGRLVKFTVTVSDRPGGIAELTRLLANLGVSIKDMLHERAWIKNDIFSVEVKVMAETRDHEHYLELRSALDSRYKYVRFANPDQIHD